MKILPYKVKGINIITFIEIHSNNAFTNQGGILSRKNQHDSNWNYYIYAHHMFKDWRGNSL